MGMSRDAEAIVLKILVGVELCLWKDKTIKKNPIQSMQEYQHRKDMVKTGKVDMI